nr:MAG TPA: hypothetical protein [Caudoviricetes sp.]
MTFTVKYLSISSAQYGNIQNPVKCRKNGMTNFTLHPATAWKENQKNRWQMTSITRSKRRTVMNREDIDILEVGNAYTALFYKKNHYQPYIVAWHFDPDSYTWDQGHYFCDLKSAKKFFAEQERNNANCKYCEKLDCPHRDCVRRLPYEKGGILACENLW